MKQVIEMMELIDDYPSFKKMMETELLKELKLLYGQLKKVQKWKEQLEKEIFKSLSASDKKKIQQGKEIPINKRNREMMEMFDKQEFEITSRISEFEEERWLAREKEEAAMISKAIELSMLDEESWEVKVKEIE